MKEGPGGEAGAFKETSQSLEIEGLSHSVFARRARSTTDFSRMQCCRPMKRSLACTKRLGEFPSRGITA
jgi:hypothetical protein